MESKQSDKSVSTPPRQVTNEIEQLDIILNILNDIEQRPHTDKEIFKDRYFRESESYILPKDFIVALDKLILDGYAIKVQDEDWRTDEEKKSQTVPKPDYYRITYSGRLFLKSVSNKSKNQPYRDGLYKARRTRIKEILIIVANVSNTIIVIFIGVMGLILTNKSSKIESTIDEQSGQIKIHKSKIDSLIKVTNDTTLLRKR